MLLNIQWIIEEIKEEIKKIPRDKLKHNNPNLWDATKAFLRGQFIMLKYYLRKWEKAQINNLTLCLKQLEKELQTKPKVSIRKGIINIKAEIEEIEK